jgi:hypothetical protein
MRILAVTALVASTSAFADSMVCQPILKALDIAHRSAVYDAIATRAEGRNQVREAILVSNDLAVMNLNLTLAIQYKCDLPIYPLAIPGPYSTAATACELAFNKRGGSDGPCVIAKWERDK